MEVQQLDDSEELCDYIQRKYKLPPTTSLLHYYDTLVPCAVSFFQDLVDSPVGFISIKEDIMHIVSNHHLIARQLKSKH